MAIPLLPLLLLGGGMLLLRKRQDDDEDEGGYESLEDLPPPPTSSGTEMSGYSNVTRAKMRTIQGQLKTLDFDPGVIDGKWKLGGSTYTAVKGFQQAYDLTADGKPGRLTQEKLAEAANAPAPEPEPELEPEPEQLLPWPRWSLWQYSGGNNFQHHPPVPGVGVVDIERWHGTLDDLKVFAHSSGITPPLSRTWPRPPPTVDLNVFRGSYSDYVARIQGLLLAQGYGPTGLLNSSGYPDGLMGSKTQSYLVDFKVKHALAADAVVDWSTWWALAYDKLGG